MSSAFPNYALIRWGKLSPCLSPWDMCVCMLHIHTHMHVYTHITQGHRFILFLVLVTEFQCNLRKQIYTLNSLCVFFFLFLPLLGSICVFLQSFAQSLFPCRPMREKYRKKAVPRSVNY